MITDRERPDPAPSVETRATRTDRRHHGAGRTRLPSGRALIGGLLVAGAAMGSIAVSTAGGDEAAIPVVVADGLLEPGTPLGPENLRVVEMVLPEALVGGTYGEIPTLEGTVARSHVADGELLQSGDVVESTGAQRAAAPAREFALRLDADRVVAGRLEPGDAVDVIATYGTGADAVTVVVLRDADVLSVQSSDDSLGTTRTVLLTLALDDRESTVALAHAVDVASLNVVRATTSNADDESGLDPFRPATATGTETDTGTGEVRP